MHNINNPDGRTEFQNISHLRSYRSSKAVLSQKADLKVVSLYAQSQWRKK